MKNFALMFLAVIAGMSLVLFGYEKLKEKERQQYINAAYLTQGIASAMPYKILMAQFWAENGKLPCSDKALPQAAGQFARQPALDAIAITDCGQLTLTFNELSGVNGGTLVLQAKVDAGSQDLVWSCLTDSFVGITKHIPQCKTRESQVSTATVAPPDTRSADAVQQSTAAVSTSQCRDDALLYRSVFSNAIDNRIPQNRIVTIGPSRSKIFFFTEIIGAGGATVSHRWFHDDVAVAEVPFEVKADRWRTWSSKNLSTLGPGTLRVEVREGECLIDQESILIADKEQIDPATLTGWQRPQQALETYLARQAGLVASTSKRRDIIDDIDESGDTRLLAAIRLGQTDQALKLIRKIDYQTVENWQSMKEEEVMLHYEQANPFLRDAKGISPVSLAHELGQTEIVEALLDSVMQERKLSRRSARNAAADVGKWGDSTIHVLVQGDGGHQRFEDGDTPLIRAIRLGDEKAVITMLRVGVTPPKTHKLRPLVDLYAHDAGGRQPLEIAREENSYLIEHFLSLAVAQSEPKWAVSRATFSTGLADSEPENCRKVATDKDPVVYFFSELTDMQGQKVRHDWIYQDKVVQSVAFDISTQRWSVQSSREFSPDEVGNWDVKVSTESGRVLNTSRLTYKMITPQIEKYPDSYLGTRCDEVGFSALYQLIKAHGPISKIQYLVDKGAVLHPKSIQGRDLFYQMLSEGNITLTRWFLKNGFDIESHPKSQKTPLMIAADQGDVPMTLYLINRGAEVNKMRYKDYRTALQVAAYQNKAEVAEALLANGADPNLPDKRGVTALGRAIGACNKDVTLVLLEHGGDASIADAQGVRPRDKVDKCIEQSNWSADQPDIAAIISNDA